MLNIKQLYNTRNVQQNGNMHKISLTLEPLGDRHVSCQQKRKK